VLAKNSKVSSLLSVVSECRLSVADMRLAASGSVAVAAVVVV